MKDFGLKVIKFVFYKIVMRVIYYVCKLCPQDNQLVLFADIRDRDMPDNFIPIYEKCMNEGYRCQVMTGRQINQKGSIIKKAFALAMYYFSFIYAYARCSAVFLVEYFPITDELKPRKGCDVVQLWHGCGAMKVMGYAASGKNWAMSEKEWNLYPIHRNYTLVTVSSEEVIPCYEKAFRTEKNVVKALGIARTDVYFDVELMRKRRQRVLEMFPAIGERKIIVFAPTFRGNTIQCAKYDIEIDYEMMREKLSNQYVFLTKFHPLMKHQDYSIDGNDFLFDVTHILTAEEALCAADILISDYSSIMFEYLLLRRPMISFIPDIEEYIGDRGFFFPYEETMPGPYIKNQSELLCALLDVESWYNVEKNEAYLKKFMSACDGNSTERIFREVFGK